MSDIEHVLDGTAPRQDQSELVSDKLNNEQYQHAMKLFEKAQSNRRMGVNVDIASLLNQIAPKTGNNQFPEELFVRLFLPMFIGEVPQNLHVSEHTWIDKVAGDERNAVDIVDKDGNVLFVVPPMLDPSVFIQARPGSQSMTRIERSYSRLKEFDAAGSQNYLNRMLTGIHVSETITEETYSNCRTWNDILVRYGKEEYIINVVPLEKDPNKDKVVKKPPTNDLIDYELDTD